MQEGLLPLFPLQIVLLPRESLPLHIFEDRYKEMIRECLSREAEFGVVLVRDKGILRTGCTARIQNVLKDYDDGRMDILTVGTRRFEIREVNTERSFLRADVEYFDDDDFDDPKPEDLRQARLAHQEFVKASGSEESPPLPGEPLLSFALARISSDSEFRQALLTTRSEAERMDMVAKHLRSLVARQRTQAAVRKAARGNGHGAHLGDLSNIS